MRGWHPSLLLALAAAAGSSAGAAASSAPAPPARIAMAAVIAPGSAEHALPKPSELDYQLKPGDIVTISVWKEKDLQTDALVGPDGGISFPLVGDFEAAGHTLRQVRDLLVKRLTPFIPDPVVTVAIKQIGGDDVYVLGRVNRPGEYPFSQRIDVMQALSLAGGTTPFAALDHIVILHRDNQGEQHAIHFHYAQVAHGRDLSQNVLLHSGDTVVVP